MLIELRGLLFLVLNRAEGIHVLTRSLELNCDCTQFPEQGKLLFDTPSMSQSM